SIANVEYATADVQTTQGSRGAGPGQAGRAGAGQDQDRKEPVLLSMTHPKYTAEAMRQKIQGTVELELDIDADGVVTGARVVKSLDTMYGLDDQAIAAAMKTTFRPATENGLAVGTTVKFQMEFRLH
ncbi:MAG: energy transducer TonB, partial [Vicinamibacterales bacterium]